MSQQQEFLPPSQSNNPASNEEQVAQAFSWPNRSRTSDMPKSEHPSTYEEVPPHSYAAQDQPSARRESGSQRRRNFSPDGDAFERSYRPYNQPQPQQVPSWARPLPRQMSAPRFIWSIIICFMILLSLPILYRVAEFLFVGFFFLFILPILIVFALIVVFTMLIAHRVFRVPVSRILLGFGTIIGAIIRSGWRRRRRP